MNRLLTLIFLFIPAGLLAQYSIEADVMSGCRPLTVNFSLQPQTALDSVTSITWNFGTLLIPESSEPSPTLSFDSLGIYYVTCSIATENVVYGVIGTDTITVFNCDDSLHIPNVFTPNDDNLNDRFSVDTDGTSIYSFKIFTRSGTLIYETESPAVSWDGRSFSGQKMKQGVYYYTIRRKDSVPLREIKGFVYLFE